MKKVVLILSMVALLAGAAFAKTPTFSKKAGSFQIDLTLEKNPPVADDDNPVTLVVKNAAGAVVSTASVVVEYSMPAMPGMPAMNYKEKAVFKNGEYTAIMDLSMAGPWNITVKINDNGQKGSAKFSIDAR